jgi:uncharacterized protein (DUF305 family)
MRKLSITLIVLVIAGLVLSACGGAPAAPASQPAATTAPAAEPTMAMEPTTAPAAATEPTTAAEPTAASSGMAHTPGTDESYDVHFIDSTIEHHAGVLMMAEQALKEGQSVAVKDFAQKSMTNAQAEIDKLKAWRTEWHPNAAKMEDDMDMGNMGIAADASKPFDQRFAEAMISHHQGMIDMANEGLAQLERAELKQFAQDMIASQQAEIAELQKLVQ